MLKVAEGSHRRNATVAPQPSADGSLEAAVLGRLARTDGEATAVESDCDGRRIVKKAEWLDDAN